MPLTRSATSRSKVQASDSDSEEDHSQSSLTSTLNKQSENGNEVLPCRPSNGEDMARAGELPNTIKDGSPEDVATGSGSELRTSTALMLLLLIFLTSAVALGAVYLSFPQLEA